MSFLCVIMSTILLVQVMYAQSKNDTLVFKGFIGINYDTSEAPEWSRKIFPKNRFLATKEEVNEFESELVTQYGAAIKKHHLLFYEEYKTKYADDPYLKDLEEYRDRGTSAALEATKKIKKEYGDFDRAYYGYIGLNGMKYLRVHFWPHKVRYESIPGAGETQMYNLPHLVYNLDKHELSLAGWTGENDDKSADVR